MLTDQSDCVLDVDILWCCDAEFVVWSIWINVAVGRISTGWHHTALKMQRQHVNPGCSGLNSWGATLTLALPSPKPHFCNSHTHRQLQQSMWETMANELDLVSQMSMRAAWQGHSMLGGMACWATLPIVTDVNESRLTGSQHVGRHDLLGDPSHPVQARWKSMLCDDECQAKGKTAEIPCCSSSQCCCWGCAWVCDSC